MKPFSAALVLAVGGVLLAVAGCTPPSQVDLVYDPAAFTTEACTRSASLVALQDDRKQEAIGKSKQGEPYYAADSVSEWISRALHRELERNGCEIDYHEKEYAFDTDYLITGRILKLNVTEHSFTEYSGVMELKIVIKEGDVAVFSKEYSSTFAKTTLPSASAMREVMTELLQGMMQEVVPEVVASLR